MNNQDVLLPAPKVRDRYGVSDMTLHRWLKDERLGFPRPLVIQRRRYFREADLMAWERSRAKACA